MVYHCSKQCSNNNDVRPGHSHTAETSGGARLETTVKHFKYLSQKNQIASDIRFVSASGIYGGVPWQLIQYHVLIFNEH
jgi:hypothetical protein